MLDGLSYHRREEATYIVEVGMLTLIEDNKTFNYKIYRSSVVVEHQSEMIDRINFAHQQLMKKYGSLNTDSTWLYKTYNIFSLIGPSKLFYELFYDLTNVIKSTIVDKDFLWFQSWLNFHEPNEVLNWHNHHWYYHGYISIDPKKTKTIFKEYEILNQVGNIYIGPGNREHKVQVLRPYEGKRITLGFDVTTNEENPSDLISLIPII